MFLVCVIGAVLYWQPKPKKKEATDLKQKEIDALCAEWTPEPLLAPKKVEEVEKIYGPLGTAPKVIGSSAGRTLVVEGQSCVNFATVAATGLADDKRIIETGKKAIEKYAVGTCGPRGFYGTLDLHLELEERFAKFAGTPQAILYSFGYATLNSVIPAFLKVTDLIVIDEFMNAAGWSGAELSRCQVVTFKHNDMADLERVLDTIAKADEAKPKKVLNRRFILVESIYTKTGAVLDLPKLIALKDKYKYRVILDESLSFGVLGKTGRGITEHFGVSINQIEIITASLSHSFASMGGICCGSGLAIDHQRLASSGYVFSASLPGYLAATAIKAIDIIDSDPSIPEKVRTNSQLLHKKLKAANLGPLAVAQSGQLNDLAPIVHIVLKDNPPAGVENRRNYENTRLHKALDALEAKGFAVELMRYSGDDKHAPQQSLRVSTATYHSEKDIDSFVAALSDVAKSI